MEIKQYCKFLRITHLFWFNKPITSYQCDKLYCCLNKINKNGVFARCSKCPEYKQTKLDTFKEVLVSA